MKYELEYHINYIVVSLNSSSLSWPHYHIPATLINQLDQELTTYRNRGRARQCKQVERLRVLYVIYALTHGYRYSARRKEKPLIR